MERKPAKARLFIVIMVLLFLPLLEQNLQFIESGKLLGVVASNPAEPFSWAKWKDGSFQAQMNLHLNDSFGFRPDLVRLNNQLDFSVFRKLHAHDVKMGKNHVFFEMTYVHEYKDTSAQNELIAREKLTKLKKIQDTLEKAGKTVVLVYAPSKAYFFTNDFPDDISPQTGAGTAYHSFRRIGDSLGINQIDCNGWFLKIKDTARCTVVSKQGIHWTYYGALIAADSIARYIEAQRHIKMPHMTWDKIKAESAYDQENDLVNGLNLIFPLEHEDYYHPEIKHIKPEGAVKPKIIFFGDSYLWTFAYNNVFNEYSDDWEFWYYFNEFWTTKSMGGQEPVRNESTSDWQKKLMEKDCLVILYTEPNLLNLGNGFIEKAYDHFYPAHK